MNHRAAAVILLLVLAAPGSADYLSAVVANQSAGVATFNSTVGAGNTSWSLTHVESGAVPASQAPTDFTGATGLTASWGTNLGNLTGNFTWQVWLNVSLGTVNNSTVWAVETKSAGFQIAGPAPSPTPSPTPTPPPPPPSTGDITLFLSSPEFGVSYADILPVAAYVTASNGTVVTEVRMAIENAPPREPVGDGTACDALPTGWRIAVAGGNDSTLYRQQWDVNSSTLPLAPGSYTVYVRAQNNASKEACAVVPNVPVKVSIASASPSASPTPGAAGPGANVTVLAVACEGKPCAQGILGPIVLHKSFAAILSAPAAVAFCGPSSCEREGTAGNPGFVPTVDGRYCVRRIEPVHDSIAETLHFADGGAEACWMTGGALYGGTNKPAGMNPATAWPIKDPKDIPCTPEVGRMEPYSYYDNAARAQVSGERTVWELTADPGNPTYLVCEFSQPVYWRVHTPLCPAVNRSIFAGNGDYDSRGTTKDRPWLKSDVAQQTTQIPILCQGDYTIRTLGQDGDPTTDEWGVLGTFTVQNAAGWDAVMWALVLIPVCAAGVLIGGWVYAIPEFGVDERGESKGSAQFMGVVRGFRLVTFYYSRRVPGMDGQPARGWVAVKKIRSLRGASGIHYKIGLTRDFRFYRKLLLRLCIHSRFPVMNSPIVWGEESPRLDWEPGTKRTVVRKYDVYGGNAKETDLLWKDLRSHLAGEEHAEFAVEKSLRAAYGTRTASEEAMDERTRLLQKDSEALRGALHGEAPADGGKDPDQW